MNKAVFTLLSLSLLLGVLSGNITVALAADEIIPPQSQEIIALQRRAEKLVSDGLDSNDYHVSKARTWLDLALSESYDNDNSGIVAAAIAQAVTLLEALEQKQAGISTDTPAQIPGSEPVRPDLLGKLAALKKNIRFSCAQRPTAEGEVYLVWAGHEFAESGASHGESYIRAVENNIYAAQVAIDNCGIAPIVAPALEKITLSGDALFAFNKAKLNPDALWRLDNLVTNIKAVPLLEEVLLVGHTDRFGNPQRNQTLSEQRAESIKQYLAEKGIPADKMRTSGAGSSQPLVQCSTKPSKKKQIVCLQPNRRVEIVLRGGKEKSASPPSGN